jgi:predicted O-methyltransferase YrrM
MADARWIDEHRLEVGGALFLVTAIPLGAAPDEFVIIKTPDLVRRYLALLSREKPSRIVELGVKEAGSTALIAMAAEPDVLLAVDLAAEIPSLLARLVESENLQHRLITAFGLDQADRAGLTRFIDSHLPDERIDLVVDDASHVLGPTRTSFEVLFPRLRPGGLYVVEDWNSECITAAHLARVLPDLAAVTDRLGPITELIQLLNSPNYELPHELFVSVAAAAATQRDGTATDDRNLFGAIVEAAAQADLTSLGKTPSGSRRPLADLAVELAMIAATRPELLAEVTLDGDWLTARRGPEDLPLDGFRLSEVWADFFGYLPDGLHVAAGSDPANGPRGAEHHSAPSPKA